MNEGINKRVRGSESYGILIAIPTAIVAGPLFYNIMKDLEPEVPKGLYNPTLFSDEEMPSFTVSILTALTPVFLMAASSITKMTLHKDSALNIVFEFLGNPDMALLISVVIALFTFGLNRGKTMVEIMKSVQESALAIAMILLVVGGGGALKQVLLDSGVGNYIISLMAGSQLSPLFLAWLIASVLRITVGSATVAALTTGGIVAPLIVVTHMSPELMVLATGAGSLIIGPPNDPGFWMFKEFFNLTVKETVRSWCVMSTGIAVCWLLTE